MYGVGINKAGEIIDLGSELGVIEKSGSWYSYGSDRIGQGRDNACDFLRENPRMMAEIEQKVRVALGLPGAAPALTVVEGGSKDAVAEKANGIDAAAGKAQAAKKKSAGK